MNQQVTSGSLMLRSGEALKERTTFHIGGPARFFAELRNPHDVAEALKFARGHGLPLMVLGGGSNVLVSDRGVEAMVAHPAHRGVTVLESGSGSVTLRVAAGEPWDALVELAVRDGLWGIENLSHIPGQTGAALVQNIGAYGAQVSDRLESAEVFDLAEGRRHVLNSAECKLGYRSSLFNGEGRGRYLIWSITLRLDRHGAVQTHYPGVAEYFAQRGISNPGLAETRDAIIHIRDAKFPYPREERGGNAGSFFKNPVLRAAAFEQLGRRFRESFSAEAAERLAVLGRRGALGDSIRIPAAFLIDACGLKGASVGGAIVNETQPLVLLNQGGATAEQVLLLAGHVRRTVFVRTGVTLALEPELIGFSEAEVQKLLALD